MGWNGSLGRQVTNNRWPDHLAERLQAEGQPNVVVVNEAYSGDRVLTNGMGPTLSRFDMSVLGHPRARRRLLHAGEGEDQARGQPVDQDNTSADGLIDFDKVLDDPANPGHILAAYNCGDNLHPNDAGYQAMAKGVDLKGARHRVARALPRC